MSQIRPPDVFFSDIIDQNLSLQVIEITGLNSMILCFSELTVLVVIARPTTRVSLEATH
jgi:hypothetical protein